METQSDMEEERMYTAAPPPGTGTLARRRVFTEDADGVPCGVCVCAHSMHNGYCYRGRRVQNSWAWIQVSRLQHQSTHSHG
jgi:hypothetical protein